MAAWHNFLSLFLFLSFYLSFFLSFLTFDIFLLDLVFNILLVATDQCNVPFLILPISFPHNCFSQSARELLSIKTGILALRGAIGPRGPLNPSQLIFLHPSFHSHQWQKNIQQTFPLCVVFSAPFWDVSRLSLKFLSSPPSLPFQSYPSLLPLFRILSSRRDEFAKFSPIFSINHPPCIPAQPPTQSDALWWIFERELLAIFSNFPIKLKPLWNQANCIC